MSDTVQTRDDGAQRDHLRQLSAKVPARLPADATTTRVRQVHGWGTTLDLVSAKVLVARRPEVLELDADDIVWLKVKCRSCRVGDRLPLVPDMDDWPEGVPIKLNALSRIALWIAQRWCCEACSLKETEAFERKGADSAAVNRIRDSQIPRGMAEQVSWRSMIEKGSNDKETQARIRAIQTCKEWAAAERPKHALLLYGEPGTGKSRLAATAAMARMHAGFPISWVSVAVLMAQLDAAFSDADRHAALRVMTGKGPVVLDDIDKLNTNSSRTVMHLFTAIDRREQNGETAVIFTANGKPSELSQKLGDVLFSRITGMCHSNAGMLAFPGLDRRLEIGDPEPETPAADAADRWGL